jgi:TRAP-type C4-dicarboxylate transport system substrate-binding protein
MLPFLVENYDQGWKFYDESKWLQAQFAKAPEKGFRFLATWEAGFRNMTTKDALATRPTPRARSCAPSRTR